MTCPKCQKEMKKRPTAGSWVCPGCGGEFYERMVTPEKKA